MIDEWLLNKIVATALRDLGLDERSAWQSIALIKLLVSQTNWWEQTGADHAYRLMEAVLSEAEAQRFLGVNRYQDILWYNQEAFDDLIWWLYVIAVVDCVATQSPDQVAQGIISRFAVIQKIRKASANSKYQVEKLLTALKTK